MFIFNHARDNIVQPSGTDGQGPENECCAKKRQLYLDTTFGGIILEWIGGEFWRRLHTLVFLKFFHELVLWKTLSFFLSFSRFQGTRFDSVLFEFFSSIATNFQGLRTYSKNSLALGSQEEIVPIICLFEFP